MTGCQLRANAATVEHRLRRREVGSSIESLVARGRELAQQEHDDGVADLVVDTEGIALADLARTVLQKVGWLQPTTGQTPNTDVA